mmetsp:Transcript_76304/g.202437  ORF Transcript_76304/g.202437 Transcript_76304/m.202437 type:complete len:221 (+) Transcript_76304:391-1053(+)
MMRFRYTVFSPGKLGDACSSSTFTTSWSSCTWFSSISSCRRRIRRALRNWFSSGRRFAPGSRSSTFVVPSGEICSVCTSTSPVAARTIIMTTTSTTRMMLPSWSCMRVDSPLMSSAENSLRVFVVPWPKAVTSTPRLLRWSLRASSLRPMGALTRVDTASAPSGFSFTFLASAWASVYHSKNFVLPSASVAFQSAKAGRPIAASSPASLLMTEPSTISLR